MSVSRRARLDDLPVAANGFVGRDPELDKIGVLLLGSARLITLIGSGGIGKTRLAAEAVRRFRKARSSPVHWVRLARMAKDADVAEIEVEVAQAVVDADFSTRSVWEALVDKFTNVDAAGRNLQTVLVMDNCEHVLFGAGHLIAELLEAVPSLTIIATSRQAIGWADEQLVAVPPLSQEQALTLFRWRAELTGRSVTTPEEAELAGRICRRVHNHPLYIQLAAARLLRQPLALILQELSGQADDIRMRWSHGPRVGAEPRHRGVSDVIAWSYDLCQEKERLLLDRMSVFAAGYDTNPEDSEDNSAVDVGTTLDAVEAVCADDQASGDGLAKAEISALLDGLVDESLVTAHITPTTVRYFLLESIRIFAKQRLHERSTAEVDEPERLAGRHRRYYRDKIAQAQFTWFSPAEQELLDWARAAWDNILLAIETSLKTPGEAALGLEISAGLIALRAPFFIGSVREMRQWTERTLAATRSLNPQPADLQLAATALIGWLALCQGRHEDAGRMLEDCVARCVSDPMVRQHWRQDPETGIGLPAPVEYVWGAELMFVHRSPAAIAVLGRAREEFRAIGYHGGEAMSSLFEALAAGFFGSAAQATAIARRHLDLAAASGARWATSWAELAWALTLTKHGDPVEALAVGRTALEYLLTTRDQWGTAFAVHIRIWSLARVITDSIAAGGANRDNNVRALAVEIAELVGGASMLRARLGVNIEELGPFADETNHAREVACGVLGANGFAAAEKAGGEVQRLAVGRLSNTRTPVTDAVAAHNPPHWRELSTVEREVAILAAAGWTNTAIAARRGNSHRTVDTHVAAILQKLAITSRKDIIRFVPEDQIGQVDVEVSRRPRR